MRRFSVKVGLCACALALALALAAGCAPNASTANSAQQANRSYMSQVNETMEQLGADLELFVDAVSRGDVVNMRTQADNAYQSLDKLSELEAPEDLSDVKKDYEDGTAKLREALDAYITFYTEIDAGTFDQAAYATRIAEIQSLYDEGVSTLKKGDETAASKQ